MRRGLILARRVATGVALAAALVMAAAFPAEAAVIGGAGSTAGGNTVQVDVAGASFATLFGGPNFYASFALSDTGALYAWGQNTAGMIGDGTVGNKSVPTNISSSGALAGKTIVQVTGGAANSIGLASDGTLYAWGWNNYGQLGQGSSTPSSSNVPLAVPMTGVLAGKTIVQVASGGQTLYALASDGSLFAWGYSQNGELGTGATTPSNFTPVQVSIPGGQTITKVSAYGNGAVALAGNGTLYAWGLGTSGQLGNGTSASSTTPVAVTMSGALLNKTVQTISTSGSTAYALTTDGSVFAWGSNSGGALGINSTSPSSSNVPVAVTGFGGRSIASIGGYAYGGTALATDGTAFVWGTNAYGTVGNGGTTNALAPTSPLTSGVLAGKTITQVMASGPTMVVLTSDGTVFSWGYAFGGNLGNGQTGTNTQASPVATTMPSVSFIVGGTSATGTRVSSTRFSFTAPAHVAGVVDLVVRVGGNGSYALTSTTLAGAYTYAAPPTLVSTLPNATAGAAYSQSVGGTGGATYAVTSGTLPAGLSLSASTGIISGTPTGSGASAFAITATIGGASAVQAFTVSTFVPPVFTSTAPTTAVVGSAFSSVPTVTGTGPLTFAVTAGSLPQGTTLNTTTGEVSGTPTAAGAFAFTVSVTGAGGTATQSVALQVGLPPTSAPSSTPTTTPTPTGTPTPSATPTSTPAPSATPSSPSTPTPSATPTGTPTPPATPTTTSTPTPTGDALQPEHAHPVGDALHHGEPDPLRDCGACREAVRRSAGLRRGGPGGRPGRGPRLRSAARVDVVDDDALDAGGDRERGGAGLRCDLAEHAAAVDHPRRQPHADLHGHVEHREAGR